RHDPEASVHCEAPAQNAEPTAGMNQTRASIDEADAQQREGHPERQEDEKGDPRQTERADPQIERQYSPEQHADADGRARLRDVDQMAVGEEQQEGVPPPESAVAEERGHPERVAELELEYAREDLHQPAEDERKRDYHVASRCREDARVDEAQQDRGEAERDQSERRRIGGRNEDDCLFCHVLLPLEAGELCTDRTIFPAARAAGCPLSTHCGRWGSLKRKGRPNGTALP